MNSSNMNNNLSTPSVPATPNQVEFSTSRPNVAPTTNPARTQRYSRDQSTNSSRRGRPRRGFGRGGPVPSYDAQLDRSNYRRDTVDDVAGRPNEGSGLSQPAGNRRRGGRASHGKYRQRQQTNQLIEGLDGLDIDLVESVAPTDSTGEPSSTGRNRHATNTRKVNLTHLLNYRYERKNQRGSRHNSYNENSDSGSYHRSNYHPYKNPYKDFDTVHKFSKQQFLQANCQFVVLDGHDYTIHKVDPDWPVDWDCIEEIKFKQSASTETTCPICLEPPIAAKITRCGHIYCWTCMLHYLSLSDENCRQCPICFEAVYKTDLRSVVSHSFANQSVGEEIVMRLMVRKKGCIEVEPYTRISSPSHYNEIEQTQKGEPMEHYCSQDKLVIVDPRTVVGRIIQRERDELSFKMELERDAPEVCFIEQALDWLDRRANKLNELMATSRRLKKSETPAEDNTIESSKSYLFYQCSDGQHIYLNPFSTKMMCHEYTSMENCPLEIRAKILQMNWVSMSDTWRKRFKYLSHLPLTCEFRLIEIDFDKSNLVSRDTYNAYEEKIIARAKERERRLREERKREKIIQVEQNRRIYGIQPTLDIDLNSIDQFPTVSDERYLGISRPGGEQMRGAEFEWTDDEEVDRASHRDDSSVKSHRSSRPETGATNDAGRDIANNSVGGSQDVTTGVTLSFAEIQLQEAAKEAASVTKDSASSWGPKKGAASGASARPASSFAKMVVDAKASQKAWTRSVGSTSAAKQAVSQNNPILSSQQRHHQSNTRTRRSTESDDEEGGEQLRAPPCEFTISDFIEMNVVSGSSKKKGGAKSKKSSAK